MEQSFRTAPLLLFPKFAPIYYKNSKFDKIIQNKRKYDEYKINTS